MLKHTLRLLTGRTLKAVGLTEFIRKIYFQEGHKFLLGIGDFTGAWFRRSVVSEDFVPVISDIDITILLNSSQVRKLFRNQNLKRRPLLLQDIQLVYEPFLTRWQRTGGLRNRQINSWIPFDKNLIKISSPAKVPKDLLAFEVAQELYLLYKQLAPKLGLSQRDETSDKIFFELNRLIQFWTSLDESVLQEPRKNFYFPVKDTEAHFFKKLNSLCIDVLRHIDPQLTSFTPRDLLLENGEDWMRLNLTMESRFVNICAAEDIRSISRKFRSDFVVTSEFVSLIKGIGIQDQPLLNRLAWQESGYYRDFCTQRLAHDLIGSVLLDPENSRQLYFCLKNIDEFLKGFIEYPPTGWSQISSWKETEPFPLSREMILSEVYLNLELLESIR